MKYLGFILALQSWAATNAFTVAPGTPGSRVATELNLELGNNSQGVVSKTAEWEFNKISPIARVEGSTRHTWNFMDASRGCVQVAMNSPGGRPIDAECNLWQGPNYTPASIKCHSEDGKNYPIQLLMGTKNKCVNVEVKNTAPYTFPLNAAASYAIEPLSNAGEAILEEGGTYIEGGAVRMQPIPAEVEELQVMLTTQGKTIKAKIELLNGPNNVKAEYEIYASNGDLTSLFIVFPTPSANAIRIKNLATLEYPLDYYTKASKKGAVNAAPMWLNN